MGDDDSFTIDELAAEAGMTTRNVRAYGTKGLLPPPFREGRSSSYRRAHLDRLHHIKLLREGGLPLKLIVEAARRGDDLSPRGPLSKLTATFASSRADRVVDVAALEPDQSTRDDAAALMPPGSPAAELAARLDEHGVTQATILLILLQSARSGHALSAELSRLLCTDLLTAGPQDLPRPVLDDTVALALILTAQALTETLPVSR